MTALHLVVSRVTEFYCLRLVATALRVDSLVLSRRSMLQRIAWVAVLGPLFGRVAVRLLGWLRTMQVRPDLCLCATVIHRPLSAAAGLMRMRVALAATFRVWRVAMVQLRLMRLVMQLVGRMTSPLNWVLGGWTATDLLLCMVATA